MENNHTPRFKATPARNQAGTNTFPGLPGTTNLDFEMSRKRHPAIRPINHQLPLHKVPTILLPKKLLVVANLSVWHSP